MRVPISSAIEREFSSVSSFPAELGERLWLRLSKMNRSDNHASYDSQRAPFHDGLRLLVAQGGHGIYTGCPKCRNRACGERYGA